MPVTAPTSFKVYRYRWIILLTFMLAVAFNQLLWITFAPITSTTVFRTCPSACCR
jgi:hypothetical protein